MTLCSAAFFCLLCAFFITIGNHVLSLKNQCFNSQNRKKVCLLETSVMKIILVSITKLLGRQLKQKTFIFSFLEAGGTVSVCQVRGVSMVRLQ